VLGYKTFDLIYLMAVERVRKGEWTASVTYSCYFQRATICKWLAITSDFSRQRTAEPVSKFKIAVVLRVRDFVLCNGAYASSNYRRTLAQFSRLHPEMPRTINCEEESNLEQT
jgi:hypothetical protein